MIETLVYIRIWFRIRGNIRIRSFSALLPTTLIIFRRRGPERGKLLALWATRRTNIHELKLEQFSALWATNTQQNVRRCGQ